MEIKKKSVEFIYILKINVTFILARKKKKKTFAFVINRIIDTANNI